MNTFILLHQIKSNKYYYSARSALFPINKYIISAFPFYCASANHPWMLSNVSFRVTSYTSNAHADDLKYERVIDLNDCYPVFQHYKYH